MAFPIFVLSANIVHQPGARVLMQGAALVNVLTDTDTQTDYRADKGCKPGTITK
jgi:hypothetical protein